MPKISIIVPVYKVEKYLHRCLNSIANQSFTDWECILVDDGSPDNSGKICDEYAEKDERFRVIHQENAGVSAARNKGLDEAKGEWITFIDSDDWIELNAYEIVSTNFNDNVDIVCFGMKFYYSFGKIEYVPFLNNVDLFYMFNHYQVYMHSPCNKLYSRKIVNDKRFDVKLKLYEDLVFNFEIMIDKYSKIKFIDNHLYCYYMVNENSSDHILLSHEKIESRLNAYLTILNICSQKKLQTESHKYLRRFSSEVAMPYINDLQLFNPIKFRSICFKWSFYSYHPKIFFQFLFAFLKLDSCAKLILKIKHWLKY